ncbi:hypothetical protein NDU88_005156 [Pleurodeles waltl]|uniref:Uncharacterized protein n=1 Tax=Pleurodeles waltl TaxID=8319 RepID=A0AAV7NN57_PLEWA|nr:hypothetical protein NDU88_005156 [Pleurodeles waltl]
MRSRLGNTRPAGPAVDCPEPWRGMVPPPSGRRHRVGPAETRPAEAVNAAFRCLLSAVRCRWAASVELWHPRVDPPAAQAWRRSFGVWAAADGVALKREDALGLRQYPLSDRWGELEPCLQAGSLGSSVSESD